MVIVAGATLKWDYVTLEGRRESPNTNLTFVTHMT